MMVLQWERTAKFSLRLALLRSEFEGFVDVCHMKRINYDYHVNMSA
jgi:hypothetical protein